MNKIFCLLYCLYFLISCNDKKVVNIDKNKKRIDSVCDEFMSQFKAGEVSNAMKLLRSNSVLIGKSDLDTLESQISAQFKAEIFSQYGEVQDYQFVGEHKIKEFAARRYYVIRYKHFFLKFVFSLYAGGSGWSITGFKYNEDMSDLY